MQKKVLLVTNIPTPYRIPLFNELQKQLAEKGISFKVIFGAHTYSRRKWQIDMEQCQFDYEVLNSRTLRLGSNEKTMFSYKGLLNVVNREKPAITIIIGFSSGTLKLFLRSFFKKTKYIIWSGSLKKAGRNDSFLRICFRKILIIRAVAFISYGQKAKDYLISLGAPANKIYIAINTVDTDFFSEESAKLREKNPIVGSPKHLTYIGYLEPRKNVKKILEIAKILYQQRNDFVLDIIGDGSEKEHLSNFVEQYGLHKIIRFHGLKQKHELPEFLASSNCFLFQTDFDIWGLVLNEAMAAGVPCISSVHAGATYDLIIEGETGFSIDFNETDKVTERINWIFDHPEEASRIGNKASRFMHENASLEKSAAGFVRAIEFVFQCQRGDR